MSQVGAASPDAVERLRRWTAPPVALLAAVTASSCLLNVVAVARSLPQLTALDAGFVGWVGFGAFAAIAVGCLALLSADRIGSGPFLALGAVAAVFGLSVAHRVTGGGQLALAVVVCGLAAGALFAGTVATTTTLPAPWARATLAAWAGALVVAWPLLTAALGPAGPVPAVVVDPPIWMLAAVAVLIVSWGVLTMLVEPLPEPGLADPVGMSPWPAVCLLCAVAALLTTVLGFNPRISLVWLRPVVVTGTALVVAGWALAVTQIADRPVRLAYVAVSSVGWVVPATTEFAVRVGEAGRASHWVVCLPLVAIAAVGVAVGTRRKPAVIPIGFALMAVAGVATWAMSAERWVMVAAIGPLVAAGTAIVVTGVCIAAADARSTRLVGTALIGSLVLGQVLVIPLDWALLGDVPGNLGDAIASGRLDAGLTVAVAGLAAAWTEVTRSRMSRHRIPPADRSDSYARPV